MGNNRRNHPTTGQTLNVTPWHRATTNRSDLDDLTDDELDEYIWGPLVDPKGTYRLTFPETPPQRF